MELEGLKIGEDNPLTEVALYAQQLARVSRGLMYLHSWGIVYVA